MIYLITGASHTGKTALSQRLLEALKFPYLSIDHLKMGLIRSGQTNLTPADDDKLTDYLWPIVREFIKTAIENKQNLIVEGCYIPFEWRKDFESEYISQIKFICLALTERYIDEHFEDIRAHGSDIEQRFESDEASLSKDYVKKENLRFTEGFTKAGEQVFLIDQDYEQVIEKLIASSKS
ncbi:MAG: adenylate kinase [Treponema sp.]|nr:adenylate kinase [Treponema sp.]